MIKFLIGQRYESEQLSSKFISSKGETEPFAFAEGVFPL